MIKYCKAYPIQRFRAFDKWTEKAPVNKAVAPANGDTPEAFLYLHESYIVTDQIFPDKKVIFDEVTPDWVEFCKNDLKFELPSYEIPTKQPAEQAQA